VAATAPRLVSVRIARAGSRSALSLRHHRA
jgi:hypothetical protein